MGKPKKVSAKNKAADARERARAADSEGSILGWKGCWRGERITILVKLRILLTGVARVVKVCVNKGRDFMGMDKAGGRNHEQNEK